MELSLVNRKGLICIQASLIGFILLFVCVNQGWRPGSVFPSLSYRQTEPADVRAAVTEQKHAQQALPQAPAPSFDYFEGTVSVPELLPQPVAPSPPGNDVPPLQSDVELFADATPTPVPVPRVQDTVSVPELSPQPVAPLLRKKEGPPSPSPDNIIVTDPDNAARSECDIFDGRWVFDEKAYPLYQGRRCPILSNQVNCQMNGRPDSGYEHWRWEAKGCEIPRFNGTDMLERLRGKRMILVGDSLNRNQWESLACLLYSATAPSRAFFKIRSDFHILKALDYDCTVEFYWSPFLVPMEGAADQPKVLKLDKLPPMSKKWVGADVMVFNTGHWWTHRGRFKHWTYLERNGKLVQEMEGDTAFETAMKTWAGWVDRWVDPNKTTVFFRSVSPEHKNMHWCYNQTTPITDDSYKQWFPRSMRNIVERTIIDMKTPVKYLNITGLSEFRRDAHTGLYSTRGEKLLTLEQREEAKSYADCSHWCLPGLPDTWNVLIYAFITGFPSVIL